MRARLGYCKIALRGGNIGTRPDKGVSLAEIVGQSVLFERLPALSGIAPCGGT